MRTTLLFPTIAEMPPAWKTRCAMELSQFQDYSLLCTGPGRQIVKTMERFSPYLQKTCLLILGYAGAITPGLQRGDIVVCKGYFAAHSRPLLADALTGPVTRALERAGLDVWNGNSYTSEHIVSDPKVKRSLVKEGPMLLVVEMENYWAARKAREMGCPFISIRIILDLFAERLPDLTNMTPYGDIAWLPIFWHLIRFPHHLWSMLKIYRYSHVLLPRLSRCCLAIVKELTEI